MIIDEWLTYKVSDKLLRFLYELFELRSEKHPTIFVTQYEIDSWHERLTGDRHADSIMDRIIHNRINVESTNENIIAFLSVHKLEITLFPRLQIIIISQAYKNPSLLNDRLLL